MRSTINTIIKKIALPLCALVTVGGISACQSADSNNDSQAQVAPAKVVSSGPTLQVSESTLAAAYKCYTPLTGTQNPVLLIHGTGNTSKAWDESLGLALTNARYEVCTVQLPAFSWNDVQISTEYVVSAIRQMSQQTNKKVAIIGHSQGALEMMWAIHWWPDIQQRISDYIGLAGVNHGAPILKVLCAPKVCRDAGWQMKPGSNLLNTLSAGDETPGNVPYSSIYTTTDTIATPPTSVLVGANNVSVQDICPGRKVSHDDLLSDAVGFALVIDALTHDGPVQASRINKTNLCKQTVAPGLSEAKAKASAIEQAAIFAVNYPLGKLNKTEPALASYASAVK